MEKLIVGLGNPGAEYTFTRHNVGFLFVDYLAQKHGVTFRLTKKHEAETAEITIDRQKILLIKPTTFMNRSGRSIASLTHFYKLPPENVFVIHDDLDISEHDIRFTKNRGAGGHNGVQSIIDSIGTKNFARIRVGIGRPVDTLGVCMEAHNYVLKKMNNEEQEMLAQIFPKIEELLIQNIQ